ncbi:hypothetical protein [Burkholderia sp. Ed8]|uniref:hypothetical protein n=1 Tax=Burkholderia sp. Ed8 TaxID=3112957 RepID=UPI00345CA899
MLPVDVNVSTWDSALEGPTTSAPVRLGFSLLRGMRVTDRRKGAGDDRRNGASRTGGKVRVLMSTQN